MMDFSNGWVVWGVGCIIAAILIPIAVFKVYKLPPNVGGIITLQAVSLIPYSWATVVVVLIVCTIKARANARRRKLLRSWK